MFAGAAGGAIFCRAATKAAAACLVAAVLVVAAGAACPCVDLVGAARTGVAVFGAAVSLGLTGADATAATLRGLALAPSGCVATAFVGLVMGALGAVTLGFTLALVVAGRAPLPTVGAGRLDVGAFDTVALADDLAAVVVLLFDVTVTFDFVIGFGAALAAALLTLAVFALAVFAPAVLAAVAFAVAVFAAAVLAAATLAAATLAGVALADLASAVPARLVAGADADFALAGAGRAGFTGALAGLAAALRLPTALVEAVLGEAPLAGDGFAEDERTGDRPAEDDALPVGFAPADLAAIVLAGMGRHTPCLARVGNGPDGARHRELEALTTRRAAGRSSRTRCGTSEGSAR